MVFTLDPVLPLNEGTRSVCMDRNVEEQGLPAPHHPWLSQEGLETRTRCPAGKSGATCKREERRTGDRATGKELRVGLTPGVVPVGWGSRKSWAGAV